MGKGKKQEDLAPEQRPPASGGEPLWDLQSQPSASADTGLPVLPPPGVVLTDDVIERLADEAEQGYDVRHYIVHIEASDDGEIWQAVTGPETVATVRSAENVAEDVVANQDVVEGGLWRVRVWEGSNALDGEPDLGAAPTAEYYPPTMLLAGSSSRNERNE